MVECAANQILRIEGRNPPGMASAHEGESSGQGGALVPRNAEGNGAGDATAERCLCCRDIHAEIAVRVAVADVLYHAADKIKIIGHEAVFHVATEEIAEDAAKVFVTRG